MPMFLDSEHQSFNELFQSLLSMRREDGQDVDKTVESIINEVRRRGDAALIEFTNRFDRLDLTPKAIRISDDELENCVAQVTTEERKALELAVSRIRAYHEKQVPEDHSWREKNGAELGWRWRPVSAAGLYVPGGLASYPSSVLMNAIPANVAGVARLVVTVPTPDGIVNPLVLLAARLSGVNEIYRVGGAQAIAALAYGTETIDPVDKITGPGNAYVAAAKKHVFGKVGIDMIAGPSEILIIADEQNDPNWLALDLLSQAEHDENAQAILITLDEPFGRSVANAIDNHLKTLQRANIARASWDKFGAIITVPNLEVAVELANQIAPEHLQLCVQEPQGLSHKINHAGAIFLGALTPEAIGDYIGGPNHVLPTARSARFSSGLSVLDFMKRTTLSSMSAEALRAIGPAAETLAKAESLEAHGLSIRARLKELN